MYSLEGSLSYATAAKCIFLEAQCLELAFACECLVTEHDVSGVMTNNDFIQKLGLFSFNRSFCG